MCLRHIRASIKYFLDVKHVYGHQRFSKQSMLSLELVLLLAVLTRIWSSVPWNVAETKPSQTRVPACPWHASSPFIALSHTILQQGPSHGGAQANRQPWLLGRTGSCSCPSLTEKKNRLRVWSNHNLPAPMTQSTNKEMRNIFMHTLPCIHISF